MQALVVDDSRTIRTILKRMLCESGFTVHEAENGVHALQVLHEAGACDVALVDWNMPKMNGLEFIRALRADDTHSRTWVMMVTTECEASQVVKALVAGANEYVMKPFTKDVILGKLKLMGLVPA